MDKDRKRLLANLLNPKQRAKIAEHDDEIDWQRVGDLAHTPRADSRAHYRRPRRRRCRHRAGGAGENILPEGSNWDGQSGLLVDEKTFNDLLNGRDKAPPVPPQTQAQTQISVH